METRCFVGIFGSMICVAYDAVLFISRGRSRRAARDALIYLILVRLGRVILMEWAAPSPSPSFTFTFRCISMNEDKGDDAIKGGSHESDLLGIAIGVELSSSGVPSQVAGIQL
jgi:hypothetical protein